MSLSQSLVHRAGSPAAVTMAGRIGFFCYSTVPMWFFFPFSRVPPMTTTAYMWVFIALTYWPPLSVSGNFYLSEAMHEVSQDYVEAV